MGNLSNIILTHINISRPQGLKINRLCRKTLKDIHWENIKNEEWREWKDRSVGMGG